MKTYKDSDNDSNIKGYEYGDSWIRVYFKDDSEYEYSNGLITQYMIDQMKHLADRGDGLNAYINQHKPRYSSKK